MKFIFTLALYCFLLIPSVSNGQVTERLFADTTQLSGGTAAVSIRYQNTLIVGGLINNGNSGIVCLDTSGNTLWSLYLPGALTQIRNFFIGNEGFLYAAIFDYSTNNIVSWKLNPQNGSVIWKKQLPSYDMITIMDYDSSKYLMPYTAGYNGLTYHTRFALVSKSTGDTLSTYLIGQISWMASTSAFLVDSAKNIYYTHTDSIMKVSGSSPSTFLWKKRYDSIQVQTFGRLFISPTNGSLYALGVDNGSYLNGFIAKIDPFTGTLLKSVTTSIYSDLRVNNAKIIGDDLYASWQHIYVGSISSYHRLSKYNMLNDTLTWNIAYNYNSAGLQSIMDFDLGDSGYVYATGYTDAPNYGPGLWSTLKIHPTTGAVMSTQTLTDNLPAFNEDYSMGIGIVSLGPTIAVIGNIQLPNVTRWKSCFFKLSSQNLSVLDRRDFGNYNYPSRVIGIKKHPNGNTVVYKQLGKRLQVEMTNTYGNTMWQHSYSLNVLQGYQLDISPLGDIYFSATVSKDSADYPYKSARTDSIIVYHMNALGVLKGRAFYTSGIVNTAPVQLIAGDSFAVLLFQQNNTVYALKTCEDSVIKVVNTQMLYQTLLTGGWKAAFNKSGADLYLFGRKGTLPRILKIRKAPFVCIDTLSLPSFNFIEHLLPVDTSKVVLIGKNASSQSLYGVYNTTTMTMQWTTAASSTFIAYRAVVDPDSMFVYIAGKTSTNDIRIQKHNFTTGTLLKSYTYVTGSSNNEIPFDLSYNPIRHSLLISGMVASGSNSSILILNIDSALTTPWVYARTNSIGNDAATCIEQVTPQKAWTGGYTSSGLQSGILLEVMDTIWCQPSRAYETAVACGAYIWKGKYLNQSGIYFDTSFNSKGCDSISMLTLTIKPTHSIIQNIQSCGPYTWNGITYTTSGNYSKLFTNIYGCDSMVILVLSVRSNLSNHTLSACDSLFWINRYLKITGIYRDTLVNRFACDSIVTLNLTINHPITVYPSLSLCKSFFFNNNLITTSGIYSDTLQRTTGCDSIVILNLTILPTAGSSFSQTTCGSYLFHNTALTHSGTYKDTLTAVNGCDSVVVLNLTILPASAFSLNQTACNTYMYRNITLTQSGTYRDTLTAANGCDSIVSLHLTLFKSDSTLLRINACNSYSLNGNQITTSGIYTDSLTNKSGCDSIVWYQLTINHTSFNAVNIQSCAPVIINSKVYVVSGIYKDTLLNSSGCDSIITYTVTINRPDTVRLNHNACRSFNWRGNLLTASGVYTETLVNSNGCDSILELTLTINNNHQTEYKDTACTSFIWRGKTILSTGIYYDSLTTVSGCDSIFILHATILTLDTSIKMINDTMYSNHLGGSYQWFNCQSGLPIAGATSKEFYPATSGNYAVIVSNSHCADTSFCFQYLRTGLSHPHIQPEYLLAPNPFNEFTVLSVPIHYQTGTIHLFNVWGQLLRTYNLKNQHELLIPREQLQAGIYFLKISLDEKFHEVKLIVGE